MRFSYLGPRGTFTHMALSQLSTNEEEHVPAIDVPAALRMVRSGETDFAVVPIENSVEGGVNATIDSLSNGSTLRIVAEMLVPITFVLAAKKDIPLDQVKRISTHPHAWAQCQNWIAENLTEASHVPATSTAGAAKAMADGALNFDAVLCNPLSAEQYGLTVIAEGVADNPDAVTRFICVGTEDTPLPEPTGSDKTTLQVQLPSDEAGALLTMLEQFATRGVNLSRIESRPVGDSLGRYQFSIDCEGHVADERVQAVLIGLHRTSPLVRFFGSYPSALQKPVKLRPGTANQDFASARGWVASLLN
ncbi:MAG: prephenate dehydratase [Flaviflexus sp.]|uniref:prephenate dehydratase n=1 Tax=Flaviflexus sp. TaxID=1969482 RepID=UPI00352D4D80